MLVGVTEMIWVIVTGDGQVICAFKDKSQATRYRDSLVQEGDSLEDMEAGYYEPDYTYLIRQTTLE